MCSVAVCHWLRRSAMTLAALALVLSTACGSHYVSRGSALYADGHYVEAAEVFERTEDRLATSSRDEQARFGLYRGATFLMLGDVEHAARWLGYARSIVKVAPDALGTDDLALLAASLKALGPAGTEAPERKDGSELATAPAPPDAAPVQ